MNIVDIHTHIKSSNNAIYSHSLLECDLPLNIKYWSASIHPWTLTSENADKQLSCLKELIIDKKIIAVGEAGLDKISSTPFDLQLSIFKNIAEISNQANLPLIIHSVKSTNELIDLHKQISPSNVWIIHGFRGKKELAQELIRHGFYLSFGEKYNVDTLKSIPLERLFFETDESLFPIDEIIKRASQVCEIPEYDLRKQISNNIDKVFFK